MSPFQFDRIYPNKYEMDKKAATDGVLIGRYVLVEYGNEQEGSNNNYQENLKKDNGGQVDIQNLTNYDSTIWQKILNKREDEQGKIIFEEKYIHIASLNAEVPVSYKVVEADKEPKIEIEYPEGEGKYHEPNYVFNLPKAWDIKIKDAEDKAYSDETEEIKNENTNEISHRDLNIYYNKKAFDNINFKKATKYTPNKYFYKEDDKIVQVDNNNEIDSLSQNGHLYIGEEDKENLYLENPKPENENEEKKYYNVEILDNDIYLWEEVKDENKYFYTLGDPTFLFLDGDGLLLATEGKLVAENINEYLFQQRIIENGIDKYVNFQFSDDNDNEAKYRDLLDGMANGEKIICFKYTLVSEIFNSDSAYQPNNVYYDSNYEEINIVEQANSQEKRYYVRKDSVQQYYKKVIGETKVDTSESATPGRDYYEGFDDDGDGEIDRLEPIDLSIETDWKKNYYYEYSEDENFIDSIYEEKDNGYYYLSTDDEFNKEKVYYKKEPYKIIEKENRISLENTNNSIKELSLILPGLGNTIAKIYDLLYGEERSSFIYDDYGYNPNMYDNSGEIEVPLYNVDKKTVIGLINSIYDTIGRMKIKDLPDELNPDTVEDSDLIHTLFKKDDKYYLIIKRPGAEEVSDDFINITLPKGRMKGDIDGDGFITYNPNMTEDDMLLTDGGLVFAHVSDANILTDEVQLWCADAYADGEINNKDAMEIFYHTSGDLNLFCDCVDNNVNPDYYNNWNYHKIDDFNGYFYRDISIEGITEDSKVVLHTSAYEDCFIGVECSEGVIRIKAERLPLENIDCTLDWRPKWIYKAELFNEKSLYHLIAEMQHLVSGSYEGIFEALDNELDIVGDNYINVKNIEENGRFYYELKHKKNFDQTKNNQSENAYLNMSLDETNNNIVFAFTSYPVDEAGHIVNSQKITRFGIPRAYAEGNDITESAPIGSFWYDTSDQATTN